MPAQFIGLRNDSESSGLTSNTADRTTRDGAKVATAVHGDYLEATIRSRLYTGVSASTGVILLQPGNNEPTLWNPSSSARYLSIVRLELSWVVGDCQPAAIQWTVTTNTGAAVGTAQPILTMTRVTPTGMIGGPVDNKGQWAPAAITFTAVPSFLRPTGLSMFTGIGTTAVAPFTMRADYDGDFVLGPGTAITLCVQPNITTNPTYQVALTWEEVPV